MPQYQWDYDNQTGSAPTTKSGSFDWAGLASLINTAYGMYKGNQDPKFFKAPPTEAEQWALNARKDQYQNNAARNYVGEYAKQFMSSMGDMNPNFRVSNSRDGSSAFMGGIRVPTFDASKFPQIGGNTKPAGSAPPTNPVGPNAEEPSKGNINGDPFGSIGSPAGGPGDPFAKWPTNPNATNYTWDDVKRIAAEYGPQALSLLSGGGLASMGINKAIDYLRSRFGGGQQLPTNNTRRPIDILKPGGTPPASPPPPPTRTPYNPPFTDQRNSDWINNFWRNLQNGGGNELGRVGKPGGRKGQR